MSLMKKGTMCPFLLLDDYFILLADLGSCRHAAFKDL